MICRLCLQNTHDLINMFENNNDDDDGDVDNDNKADAAYSKQKSMATIVSKYFWFKPKFDDPITTCLCNSCWLTLTEFDKFYNTIEKAQQQYQEKLLIKLEESIGSEQNHLNENETKDDYNDCANICKREEISIESFHIIEDSLKIPMENNTKPGDLNPSNVMEYEQINKRKRGRPKKPQRVLSTIMRSGGQIKKTLDIDAEIAKYMPLHCKFCNIEMEKFISLKHHMRIKHNVMIGYANCCGKKFMKRISLLQHLRKHLNISSYKCHICNKVFGTKQTHHKHYLTQHRKDEDKVYDCDQCTEKFIGVYLLEQHKMHAHLDRSALCKTCGKRLFDSSVELLIHNRDNVYWHGTICNICAKVIRGVAAFQRHRLQHMGIILPKIQCEDCGSWYKDNNTLNKHRKR